MLVERSSFPDYMLISTEEVDVFTCRFEGLRVRDTKIEELIDALIEYQIRYGLVKRVTNPTGKPYVIKQTVCRDARGRFVKRGTV